MHKRDVRAKFSAFSAILCLLISNLFASTAIAKAAPIPATHWLVDTTRSRLEFSGLEGGQVFHGRFTQFDAAIDFNPQHPESGNILVRVNMSQVFVDGKQRQAAITEATWLDSRAYPEAIFTSHAIKKIDATHFTADGVLTIKSLSHPVTLDFTFTQQKNTARAQGDVTIKRRDWRIGTGDFVTDTWVAYAVKIHYEIFASRNNQ